MDNTRNNTTLISQDIQEIAASCHVTLDTLQLHIGGERSIMSPHKFVLSGVDNNTNKQVIIKCSKHEDGAQEITKEHLVRKALTNIHFSDQELSIPKELFYGTLSGQTVSITEFITQEKVFSEHSLEEQFFLAIHAFESQEAFHATTHEHRSFTKKFFAEFPPEAYLNDFESFKENISKRVPNITNVLQESTDELVTHGGVLNTFDGYLIHSDFVPHNFRIHRKQFFLLDYVAFRVGNKYESWARFINFMEIHSPKLVPLLLAYVRADRGEEEYLDLRLMRIFKVGFLLNFYANSLTKTEGDLRLLTEARISFWSTVLKAVTKDTLVPQKDLVTYISQRDKFRTDVEKMRQREFTRA